MNKQILKTAAAYALGNAGGRGNGAFSTEEEIAIAAGTLRAMYPNIKQEDMKLAFESVLDDFKNMPKVKSH